MVTGDFPDNRLNTSRLTSVIGDMPKSDNAIDFIIIDDYLTDMVQCGAISEGRYAELMEQLELAFDQARSGAQQFDTRTPSIGLTAKGQDVTH